MSPRLLVDRRAKYGNVKATLEEVPGRVFDSKREAARARELVLMERAGLIRNLAFQVRFPIEVNDEPICVYVCDFQYEERRPEWDTQMGPAWVSVIEDVKSPATRTALYRLKAKLLKAVLGISIRETE